MKKDQRQGIERLQEVVAGAIAEDLAWGDITTDPLVPDSLQAGASVVAKGSGVVVGLWVAQEVFRQVDSGIKFKPLAQDGQKICPGELLATVEGKASSILKAERVALNFLQRLSGIASETRRYVEAIDGLPTEILDTRKTTPGLRVLEKYAVKAGGGRNHRMHLGDGVLIKDNHLAVLRSMGVSLKEAVARTRLKAPAMAKIEIEVTTPEEAVEAMKAGADIVLLDNMSVEEMRRAVKLVKGRALLEASGGINLSNLRAVAETGVNFISVGALTHSPKALDISLEIESLESR